MFLFFLYSGLTSADVDSTFGIYLLVNSKISGNEATKFGLDQLKIEYKPLWDINDFLSYNCTDHRFSLTPEAIKKMPNPEVRGLPFVFVAQGKRIYLGAFWTSFSSFSFGYPYIDTEFFDILGLQIKRAYPDESFAAGFDPRDSSEIFEELRANNLITRKCQ